MGLTLEIRCYLGLEYQGTQTPHHLPHLIPKSYSRPVGILTCEKLSCFIQTQLRAEQDARMRELEGLQRKLASMGERGCQNSGITLPNVTSSFHKD